MRFPSTGAALQWYAGALQGHPKAGRLHDPRFHAPRHQHGGKLVVLGDVGRSLEVLSNLERAVLVFHHVHGLTSQEIAVKITRLTRTRFRRGQIERLLVEAEQVLGEELRRRDLLGGIED
ncbi:MAG: hypothetical protein A2V83_00550 [Nitrospirae bacterium RBG_16_64_22]|nr:MAG: hypothetical protein A2V83_00550 [Nitrospirae bacterium RBG_16_64_22]